jgi:hypothetical protein
VPAASGQRLSDELDRWLNSEHERSLGTLIEAVREKSFAVLFVVLLGVPALPLPTGGATHLFEAIAMLLALQLMLGREEIWLPSRWRNLRFDGDKRERFIARLIDAIRWCERWSRPRGRVLFGHRLTNVVFGALVLGGTVAAFVAPPFSMLDTLPALGVVVLSLGVLFDDAIIVAAGVAVGAGGIALVVVVGHAALQGIEEWVGLTAARRSVAWSPSDNTPSNPATPASARHPRIRKGDASDQ